MHTPVTPPSAEELLVGCLLDRPSLILEIPLRDGLWADERCRMTAKFIDDWRRDGRELSTVAVQAGLMARMPGLVGWAIETITAIPSSESWPYWFSLARQEAAKRHQTRLAMELAHADTPQARNAVLRRLDALNRAIDEIDDPTKGRKLLTGGNQEVAKALQYIESLVERSPAKAGISTGFPGIDRLTGGMKRKEFWVIAGRPGEGKTTLAVQLLSTLSNAHACLFFSLEMSSEEIVTAMAHSESGIPRSTLMEGHQSPEDLSQLGAVLGGFGHRGLFMYDRISTLGDIESTSRREVLEHGVRFIFVDYLQRISVPKSRDRWAAIGQSSNTLKNLTMELDVTVICLAQIGREPEREGRAARLADLRGSAEIEADADVVGIIERTTDATFLSLPKVRRGRQGKIQLRIDFDRCQITEAPRAIGS